MKPTVHLPAKLHAMLTVGVLVLGWAVTLSFHLSLDKLSEPISVSSLYWVSLIVSSGLGTLTGMICLGLAQHKTWSTRWPLWVLVGPAMLLAFAGITTLLAGLWSGPPLPSGPGHLHVAEAVYAPSVARIAIHQTAQLLAVLWAGLAALNVALLTGLSLPRPRAGRQSPVSAPLWMLLGGGVVFSLYVPVTVGSAFFGMDPDSPAGSKSIINPLDTATAALHFGSDPHQGIPLFWWLLLALVLPLAVFFVAWRDATASKQRPPEPLGWGKTLGGLAGIGGLLALLVFARSHNTSPQNDLLSVVFGLGIAAMALGLLWHFRSLKPSSDPSPPGPGEGRRGPSWRVAISVLVAGCTVIVGAVTWPRGSGLDLHPDLRTVAIIASLAAAAAMVSQVLFASRAGHEPLFGAAPRAPDAIGEPGARRLLVLGLSLILATGCGLDVVRHSTGVTLATGLCPKPDVILPAIVWWQLAAVWDTLYPALLGLVWIPAAIMVGQAVRVGVRWRAWAGLLAVPLVIFGAAGLAGRLIYAERMDVCCGTIELPLQAALGPRPDFGRARLASHDLRRSTVPLSRLPLSRSATPVSDFVTRLVVDHDQIRGSVWTRLQKATSKRNSPLTWLNRSGAGCLCKDLRQKIRERRQTQDGRQTQDSRRGDLRLLVRRDQTFNVLGPVLWAAACAGHQRILLAVIRTDGRLAGLPFRISIADGLSPVHKHTPTIRVLPRTTGYQTVLLRPRRVFTSPGALSSHLVGRLDSDRSSDRRIRIQPSGESTMQQLVEVLDAVTMRPRKSCRLRRRASRYEPHAKATRSCLYHDVTLLLPPHFAPPRNPGGPRSARATWQCGCGKQGSPCVPQNDGE